MTEAARRLRRLGIVAACAVSVAVGVALGWRIVRRDSLGRLATGELVAMMGLFVLPGATATAVILERRGREAR